MVEAPPVRFGAQRADPACGVGEAGQPGDMHDPAVAEAVEVVQDPCHGLGVVGPDGGEQRVDGVGGGFDGRFRGVRPGCGGAADDDGGQAECGEQFRAGVLGARVDHEDAVHPSFGPPAAVERALGVEVLDDLEEECDPPCGEHFLDAGDQLEEEGLHAEGLGGPGEHQSQGAGAFAGQCAGGTVGLPAEFLRDPAYPGAGVLGDARPVVERERDGALRDPGPAGDVLDRRPAGRFPPGRLTGRCHGGLSLVLNRISAHSLISVEWPVKHRAEILNKVGPSHCRGS